MGPRQALDDLRHDGAVVWLPQHPGVGKQHAVRRAIWGHTNGAVQIRNDDQFRHWLDLCQLSSGCGELGDDVYRVRSRLSGDLLLRPSVRVLCERQLPHHPEADRQPGFALGSRDAILPGKVQSLLVPEPQCDQSSHRHPWHPAVCGCQQFRDCQYILQLHYAGAYVLQECGSKAGRGLST